MKQAFWQKDWFIGLTICILIISLNSTGVFDILERYAYDFGVRSSKRVPSDKISVIAIDDVSIANIGRWPWPRNIHAEMHRILKRGGAKVIGQSTFFIDPQIDPGMRHIRDIRSFYESSQLVKYNPKRKSKLYADIKTIGKKLISAEIDLNTDQKLANSLSEAGNVILAMHMGIGSVHGKPDKKTPDYITRNELKKIKNNPSKNTRNASPLSINSAFYPIKILAEKADSIGALSLHPDADGSIRSEPLVLKYYSQLFPSLALQIALRSLNLSVNDVTVNLGENVELGDLIIKTSPQLLMNTFFYSDTKETNAFAVDSFYDVLKGKIPASKYKGKTVLIGATAIGVGDTMVTPINSNMAPVLTLAHSVSSILNTDFLIIPDWNNIAIIVATLTISLYIIILLPLLSAGISATITLLLFTALFLIHYILMTQNGLWVHLVNPSILLIIGHLLLTTKRFLSSERGRLTSDAESAESNRLLGLSLQGQGQLDAAFDKFERLPKNNNSLELLYNLALDFERKRQFNKAGSVYQKIAEVNPKFRDIKKRLNRSNPVGETVMFGGARNTTDDGLLLNTSSVEKPMLGRYEIDKELGKGAMGAVYLGKDPKISRIVAIKTLALSQEFEDDELQEVKTRFFREAETAGRLSHPNIVTIYDAGEEHDLAYIAMEFLKGSDMVRYGKIDKLLPIPRVLDIIRRCAEALDYAHKASVVHRDIKPANIMYEKETDTLKITDFGIARITDSSKTKTGMVLGTPSYMSPEQLAGKKVDGRSDIFSLGVMMFQFITGSLPFRGDSMAALMYKITNDTHPKPESIRPELPRCVSVIINRALTKGPEDRYQTGALMARDLRKCLQIITKNKNSPQPASRNKKK